MWHQLVLYGLSNHTPHEPGLWDWAKEWVTMGRKYINNNSDLLLVILLTVSQSRHALKWSWNTFFSNWEQKGVSMYWNSKYLHPLTFQPLFTRHQHVWYSLCKHYRRAQWGSVNSKRQYRGWGRKLWFCLCFIIHYSHSHKVVRQSSYSTKL